MPTSGLAAGKSLSLLALVGLFLAGCGNDRWLGFVYPDRSDLTEWVELGEFDGLDACKLAAVEHLSAMNRLPGPNENPWRKVGTYECARGCKPLGDTGLRMCDETIGDGNAQMPVSQP